MPTKEELKSLLFSLSAKELGFGDDTYSMGFRQKGDHLSELLDLFYEHNPEEMISRVLEFERDVWREEDLFNYRAMLEKKFGDIHGKYVDLSDTGEYDTSFMGNSKHLVLEEFPAMLRASTTKEEMGSVFHKYVEELKSIHQRILKDKDKG